MKTKQHSNLKLLNIGFIVSIFGMVFTESSSGFGDSEADSYIVMGMEKQGNTDGLIDNPFTTEEHNKKSPEQTAAKSLIKKAEKVVKETSMPDNIMKTLDIQARKIDETQSKIESAFNEIRDIKKKLTELQLFIESQKKRIDDISDPNIIRTIELKIQQILTGVGDKASVNAMKNYIEEIVKKVMENNKTKPRRRVRANKNNSYWN